MGELSDKDFTQLYGLSGLRLITDCSLVQGFILLYIQSMLVTDQDPILLKSKERVMKSIEGMLLNAEVY